MRNLQVLYTLMFSFFHLSVPPFALSSPFILTEIVHMSFILLSFTILPLPRYRTVYLRISLLASTTPTRLHRYRLEHHASLPP
jgi:hypothetical protein